MRGNTTSMKTIAPEMPECACCETDGAAPLPISLADLEKLKQSIGFTQEDEKYLHLAGAVLADQTRALVDKWRGIIAGTPHFQKHSQIVNGELTETCSKNGSSRFQQWILDTCLRPYNQDWLNYQQEITSRQTAATKIDAGDDVEPMPYVPLREIIAFSAVINDTIKPFLAAKGHNAAEVEKMHSAWCKSVLMQTALWAEPGVEEEFALDKW